MALWLATIKALLPHVATIVTAATPHFTKGRGGDATQQAQIEELQRAVAQNAEHIKELAEQLRNAAAALEQAAHASEAKLRTVLAVAIAALVVAAVALAAAFSA